MPSIAPADAVGLTSVPGTGTDTAPDAAAAHAQTKRRAFIRALAQQAARELTAQALAYHAGSGGFPRSTDVNISTARPSLKTQSACAYAEIYGRADLTLDYQGLPSPKAKLPV